MTRRLDDDKRWEEIPDRYIEECPDALPHLDPQSWCYYIPRYMEWALTHYETSESIAVDNTIYALLLTGSDRGIDDHLRERFRKLTFEQSRAVSCFLRFMARNDDHADAMAAAKALQRYWSKFSVSLGGG